MSSKRPGSGRVPVLPGLVLCSATAGELGDLPGVTIGIGLCDALIGMTRSVLPLNPDFVVFVGTAGALPGSGLQIGQVICASSVRLGDAALALGLGYVPTPAGVHTGVAIEGLAYVDVVTNLSITSDPDLAVRHAQTAEVEHMEAYAVAHACHSRRINWACILGIANVVGPDAHAEWTANHVGCEAAARDVARRCHRPGSLIPRPPP